VAAVAASLVFWLLVATAEAATTPFTFGGPALIDTGAPYADPAAFNTMSCPSTSLCVGDTGTFGQIVSSTNPGSTSAGDWSQFPTAQIAGKPFSYSIGGVSCVIQGAAPFCLATGTDPTDSTAVGNAVFLRSTNPAAGASAWQAQRFAPSPPLDVLAPACAAGASATVCVGGSGSIIWASSDAANPIAGGEAGWGAAPFAGFACPSAALCFAAQQKGTVLSSTTPGSPSSWPSATSTSTGLSSITGFSCPTTTFCIAAGSVGGANQIATSTNPGAATPAWSVSTPSVPVIAISCATDTVLSGPGVICFSRNGTTTSVSTDGGTTWVSENLAQGSSNAFACAGATASLCVAGTSGGAVLNSANAASGTSATWSSPLLVAPGENPVQLFAQSCPSSGVCVGSDGAGRILTSTNPTSGAAAWSSALVDPGGGGIFDLACSSTGACVAFDDHGSVLTSTNPAGGASTWSAPSSSIDANGISALDCPSNNVCVATDFNGGVLTSSTPPFGPASWSAPASIAGTSYISALACPSSTTCVGIDAAGYVHNSMTPPFGATTWQFASASSIDPAAISQLACPSATACIAIDAQNRVLTATAPFAGTFWSAPSSSSIDPHPITQLVCPTSTLCVAADDSGNVLTSTTTPFGAATWSAPTAVDAFHNITGLACSSNVLCVLGDDGGNVLAAIPTLPVNTAIPTITGPAVLGQTLSVSHGSWTSNLTSYSYQWQDCDGTGNSCTAISGATAQSYPLKVSDVGHTIRVIETASNPAGSGMPATSTQTAAVTAAPANTSPPAITGKTIAGDTLSGSVGTWSATPPISYFYQWQRCGSTCTSVSGATGSTYKLQAPDVCTQVRLSVTAQNATGSSSALSGSVGPVAASAAMIKAGLLNQIVPRGKGAAIKTPRKKHRYVLSFASTCVGKLVVSWIFTPKRHRKSNAKPIVVATGKASFRKAERLNLTIIMTSPGAQLLGRSPLALTAQGSFTPTGNPTVTVTRPFTLAP
jgi:hypothetical protein